MDEWTAKLGSRLLPGVVKVCLRFGQVFLLVFLFFSPTDHPAEAQFINKHNSTLPVASSACPWPCLCPRSSSARRDVHRKTWSSLLVAKEVQEMGLGMA